MGLWKYLGAVLTVDCGGSRNIKIPTQAKLCTAVSSTGAGLLPIRPRPQQRTSRKRREKWEHPREFNFRGILPRQDWSYGPPPTGVPGFHLPPSGLELARFGVIPHQFMRFESTALM